MDGGFSNCVFVSACEVYQFLIVPSLGIPYSVEVLKIRHVTAVVAVK